MISRIFPNLLVWVFLVTPSLSLAQLSSSNSDSNGSSPSSFHVSDVQGQQVIEWRIEERELPSLWERWQYDWDAPHFISTRSETSYYGFGVWKPEEYQHLGVNEVGMEKWLLDHGVNFSVTTGIFGGNTRYRFDMRWHEKTDTEFLIQMQVPLK